MRNLLGCLLVCLVSVGCASTSVDRLQPAIGCLEPEGAGDYRFVVMGDNRPWGQSEDPVPQNEYFSDNIARANQSGADFAIVVGDLILGYVNDVVLINKEWDAYDKACEKFKIPFISVVGNHDVWNKQSQDIFRKRFGRLYFSWEHKGCHFIALDTEIVGEMNKITGKQLAWLKNDLKHAAGTRRIFVFMHKPLWKANWGKGPSENQWNRDVHPLLAKHGVDTVFAGHEHVYCLHPTRDDVRYVVTGGAGAELESPNRLGGGFFHFLTVDVAGADTPIRVITPKGEVPVDYVTPEKIAALNNGLEIQPLEYVPEGGSFSLKMRVLNPTDSPAKAELHWHTDGSSWSVADLTKTIPARGHEWFEVPVQLAGRMFPLPHADIELVRDDCRLYGWGAVVPPINPGIARPIPEWNVAGPFATAFSSFEELEDVETVQDYLDATAEYKVPVAAAGEIDLTATYNGKGGKKVAWQTVRSEGQYGQIDLDKLYHDDLALACAVSYIYAPEAGTYDFLAGSDDGVVVTINGAEVWRKHVLRSLKPDEDMFSSKLKKGWNVVVLKVMELRGGWGFAFRVVDPGHTLRFSLRQGE